MREALRGVAGIAVAALLAGCGAVTPHTVGTTLPRQAEIASVRFTIVPTKAPAGRSRLPSYISQGTQSAAVTITPAGSTATTSVINCSQGSCSGTVDAAVGIDTFAVALYDQSNGRGNVLSSGSTIQTIVRNQANSVNITFDGVAAHISNMYLGNPHPDINARATSTVTVVVTDPDGYIIVGPGHYQPQIDLSLVDPSGSTTLSATSVTAPSDVITLTYTGTPKISATISAAIHGAVATASTVFEPYNIYATYPIPVACCAGTMAIVRGPDGADWFTDGPAQKIGRIDSSGFISLYSTTGRANQIIAGPDGNLWFTETPGAKQYGRITPAGDVTEYAIGAPSGTSFSPAYLGFGNDANLYISDDSGFNSGLVWAVVPTTGAVVKTYLFDSTPHDVKLGSDGKIWVGGGPYIARINADDTLSKFTVSGPAIALTNASDGNIWFGTSAATIGKITPAGSVTEYSVPQGGYTTQIIAAADGSLWFDFCGPEGASCRIGHSTAAGTITSYAIPPTFGLAFGADGNIRLTEIGKIGVFNP